MIGTIVNAIAIIVGGILGMWIKGVLTERFKKIVMNGIGLAVLFLGAHTALEKMSDAKGILFIVSLVVGGLLGEFLDIDGNIEKLGLYAQSKFKNSENNIAQGFVSTTILYCVGTMAILGSLQSGIYGQHDILYAKSFLDGVSAVIFAATFGMGVVLSSVSVFVYQGLLTVLSTYIHPFLSEQVLTEISVIGGILIFSIGLNILEITKIKVSNYLPSIFLPILYFLLWK